jgi:predicted nucleic acid-binding protein
VLSPFVLAELDHLVGRLAGVDAQLALLDEVARGAYELATFTAHEVGRARGLAARYRDLRIGLADASVLVLARRLGDADVLTLDERHFRVLAAEYPVRLLPADS